MCPNRPHLYSLFIDFIQTNWIVMWSFEFQRSLWDFLFWRHDSVHDSPLIDKCLFWIFWKLRSKDKTKYVCIYFKGLHVLYLQMCASWTRRHFGIYKSSGHKVATFLSFILSAFLRHVWCCCFIGNNLTNPP